MLPVFTLCLLAGALGTSYLAYRNWSPDTGPMTDWQALFASMGKRMRESGGSDQRRDLQLRLSAAGLRDPEAVDLFLAIQLFTVAALAAIALVIGSFVTEGFSNAALIAVAAVAVGYLLPLTILDSRGEARRRTIAKALPGAVDLLVSTIEAGLSVEQALARVGAAIHESDPSLADELGVTAREIDAGMPLDESMRRLGRRVGLEELQSLCSVIAQASVLGARIGQSLRDYSDSARRQRIASLEERAGKLSAKLTMPIVFCLLPACLLLLLAPAVIDAIRAFGDAN